MTLKSSLVLPAGGEILAGLPGDVGGEGLQARLCSKPPACLLQVSGSSPRATSTTWSPPPPTEAAQFAVPESSRAYLLGTWRTTVGGETVEMGGVAVSCLHLNAFAHSEALGMPPTASKQCYTIRLGSS